jgi:hypothetical protein
MLGDLGVPTLHLIKTMTQFSSLLSIKPAMLPTSMLGDYSTSVSSTPSYFLRRTNLLGNPFLITSLLDLLSLPSLFWIITPAILPATMLGYYSVSASLMPYEIFSSSFRSIGGLLPIGRYSTSLRSARQQNRAAAKLICSFLDRRARYSTCR